jgi:tRNA G10  N-methylase Trm11
VCNNDALIAHVARLYFRKSDRIADVTFGRGVFWRNINLCDYEFHPSDICTCPLDPYDFRDLPYEDGSFDVVVLDPPYSHDPGKGMGANTAYRNRETTAGLNHDGIVRLYADGMKEARRVLRPRGILLVKTQDEIESSKQRMTHIEIHDHALLLGMTVEDLFVMVRPAAPPVQQDQKHARKNHSYLWVFGRGR